MSRHNNAECLFDDLRREILKVDPVSFAENFLTIDGKPLKLGGGTGWKFLADIYRYVGTTAITRDSKPVVCVKGRQVGATTMATALELYFCSSGLFGHSPDRPPIRILHCFPALSHVQKFAKDKLSTMMRTSRDKYVIKQSLGFDGETGKRRIDVPEDTLTEKQFKHENKLWVDSNASDARRLQGMSLDAIFYDEVQKMNQDDIDNSKRTLTAARYGPRGQGIQLYFGTPLNKGSNFHKMWEASDKRFYHLGCVSCSHYFMLYTPGTDDWEKIWLYANIVECPKCKRPQEKIRAVENGMWIPTQEFLPGGEEPKFVGFHFNQLLIPYFHKENILKESPKVTPTNSDRIWQNEILGEFYSGLDLPMTEDEIYTYCRNINGLISFGTEHTTTNYNPKILSKPSPITFMGVDWGRKTDDPNSRGGKSFSSVVIVSASPNGVLNIENAFMLKSNDFEHKKTVIREMYRRFDIKLTIADIGDGADIVCELQKEFGGKFIGSWSSGTLVNPVKYYEEELKITCNPHVVLEELFSQMRKGKILFPWKSYEKIHWLIEHCCSMEKKTITRQGRVTSQYVKGSGPNDGLMSLMYAYLAHKFFLTKGFRVKDFKIGVKSTQPLLAYLPGIL
jgi:hypothetical protein